MTMPLLMNPIFDDEKFNWMRDPDVRPYVFVRPDNKIPRSGVVHKLDWFKQKPVYKNPLLMDELGFGDQILRLESKAFGPSNMAMPRWVFYDCALVPGFVAGFAHKTSSLTRDVSSALEVPETLDWTPLSLFIIIPTMSREGEWVAHNLCSVNAILNKEERYYGLGFISKAFGLWYANVKICCGFTQWGNPALKLHAYYGEFEVLTAYTPIHSHARTVSYRVKVEPKYWPNFFTKQPFEGFHDKYESAGFFVDPADDDSLKSFQRKLERNEGPFFLDSQEVVSNDLLDRLQVYRLRTKPR